MWRRSLRNRARKLPAPNRTEPTVGGSPCLHAPCVDRKCWHILGEGPSATLCAACGCLWMRLGAAASRWSMGGRVCPGCNTPLWIGSSTVSLVPSNALPHRPSLLPVSLILLELSLIAPSWGLLGPASSAVPCCPTPQPRCYSLVTSAPLSGIRIRLCIGPVSLGPRFCPRNKHLRWSYLCLGPCLCPPNCVPDMHSFFSLLGAVGECGV